MLFTNLPARCIVLLEDIDTAGLLRNDPESDESKKVDGDSSSNQDFNVVNLTKALRKAQEQSEEERKKGISLSGLLNIIDGTSSFAPFCSWGPAPKPPSSLRSISQ